MIDDLVRQTVGGFIPGEIYLPRTQAVLSDPTSRAAIEAIRQFDAHRAYFNRFHELAHLNFDNELRRVKELYSLYLLSLDNVKIKNLIASAIEKLLGSHKKRFNQYLHLIQILREQNRRKFKIKSLHLPIKIIPDSLRPIKSVA